MGFCLDTCHLLVSGFDIATEAGLDEMVAEADRILGLDNVHVIHANDSKGAAEDRISTGISISAKVILELDGFRRILTIRSFAPSLYSRNAGGRGRRRVRISDTLRALWKSLRTTRNAVRP